ncbi:MAG: peptidoglycan DD-metalloendopeptidase family protein [Colwellia sp.]|nr:peptidoglycan DD-metalloendopeptidase family protein [Colwellia sp.]MCW8864583.1 peptidoglycan DD-metalloendopeptidase family protein [Colwellia sp.]MCW9081551.1 peptidoglycan DD-metalloendopeptidase family protein [Colwellia sp.]
MNKQQIIQRQLKHLHNIFQRLQEVFLQLPKQHRVIIISVCALLLLLLLLPTKQTEPNEQSLEIGKRYQVALPPHESDAKAIKPIEIPSLATKQLPSTDDVSNTVNSQQQSNISWQTVKVRSGDSLARIFKRLGFTAQDTYAVSTAKGKDSQLLRKINVGDTLRIANNDEKQITALEYPLSKTDTLYINLVGDSYQSHKESKTVEIREAFAYGTISTNFWNAGTTAGLTDGQIINLANIFGWDIDFALDIREDDTFQVIFEKKYVEGEYIGTGNILAAEFVNQGDLFQAVRFSDDEYYTPDGKSMRKAFLRAPVNFKYISSNFKPKRFHPIQKRWKAHRGTDYRANTGTPVVAAGNGKVTHATYNKYNGNYVFIQHGNGIVTKYLHFSKRAVKKGQRVKQGQIIGYVGSTGMSQAPHLHYEFLLNGVHRNPRTVKLPDAKPIAKKYKAAFNTLANKRLKELAGAKSALFSIKTNDKKHSTVDEDSKTNKPANQIGN